MRIELQIRRRALHGDYRAAQGALARARAQAPNHREAPGIELRGAIERTPQPSGSPSTSRHVTPGNARVVVARSGGPEVLSFEPAAMPQPGPGEVCVRVLRTGVAFADVMLQRGTRSSGAAPRVPGFELVGEIDAVGRDSTRKLGERVAALTIFGSYARYVVVPEERLLDVPPDLPPSVAACLPLNYLTAYMLYRVARVRTGDTVLMWGAAGGVGSAMLELARVAGIRVIAACSPAKRAENQTALITGASSGVGASFAHALAARGMQLALVARSQDTLETLAQELTKIYGVRAHVIGADLSKPGAAQRVLEQTNAKGLTIDLLVNNAGFATYGLFEEVRSNGSTKRSCSTAPASWR